MDQNNQTPEGFSPQEEKKPFEEKTYQSKENQPEKVPPQYRREEVGQAPYTPPYTPPYFHYAPPTKPKKNKKVVAWIVSLSILYLLLLAGLFYVVASGVLKDEGTDVNTSVTQKGEEEKEKTENQPIKENPSEDGKNLIVGENYDGSVLTAATLYENNVESVVFVQANYAKGYSTGSGFVIDSENGYILTNYHVVEESTDVAVTFSNGDSYTAKIIAGDEINDIAVLQIKAENLKHVTLGNSDHIKIGDDVLVIGNPLGDLTFTLTKGIVSGINRSVNTGEYNVNTFQTDAPINSGNSGGPAFDATGAVIGIASAKYAATGVEGVGFCIPINDAMKIARDLVEYGYVTGRPNFGITVSDSAGYEYTTDEFGRRVIVETTAGARIEEVGRNSCAAKAGLQAGDIVTQFDDIKIETANDLINAKNTRKAGDEVLLKVYRDGETIEIKVVLDEYTPE